MDIIPQHGGDIYRFAKACGCEVSEVIDLSSNINVIQPNITIDFNTLDIAPYPNYEQLEEAIANRYAIEPTMLELFNGATSAIYSLFRSLKTRAVTLYAPLYGEYSKASKLYGYNIHLINRFEPIDQEVKEGSLVIFVNPSTPDGQYHNIDRLMQAWIKKSCTILVDESFLDFTPYPSATPYLKTYDKLYILKSMTKFYSAAGMRIGALISNTTNIQQIKAQEPLWKISQFDSHYLQAALRDPLFAKTTQSITQANRAFLIQTLEQCPYVAKVYPSTANYLLVKLQGITAPTLQQHLIPHKIMIRNCANFDFLDEQFVRIAVKEITLLKKLEHALCEISI